MAVSRELREFRREVNAAARGLRALPDDVRKEFRARARQELAEPLVRDIQAAAPQPWAEPIRRAVTAMGGAKPSVKLGSGVRPVASGGARGRDLIPGVEWGGSTRKVRVTRQLKGGGTTTYMVAATQGFVRHQKPFVYRAVAASRDEMKEAYLRMVDDVLRENGVTGGGA